MEQLRDTPVRPTTPAAPTGPVTEAEGDVARLAAEARAAADAVPVAPATVTVTVKTTAAGQATLIATPDTPVAEVMTRACRDLGVPGGGEYLLVADGQVIADTSRTLRDVVGDRLGATLNARIVKKPEAGGILPCRS